MHSYRFADEAAEFPIETHQGEQVPFGFTAFDGGRVVEWSREKRVNGKIVQIVTEIPSRPQQTPEEIRQQKEQQLDWEYQSQFTELARAWANAMMDGDIKTAGEITADRAALKKEYEKKRGEISAG